MGLKSIETVPHCFFGTLAMVVCTLRACRLNTTTLPVSFAKAGEALADHAECCRYGVLAPAHALWILCGDGPLHARREDMSNELLSRWLR